MNELDRRRFQTKACIAGARTFLMLFNVIFWILGAILCIFGLWMRVSIGKVFEVSPHLNFALPAILVITGIVMMVMGFVACCCSSTDSPVLLYILSGIFFIVFALIFATSIMGYAYRDNLKVQLHKSLNESMHDYGKGTIIDRDWDRIQMHFECCGVNDYRDWIATTWHVSNSNISWPDSCCRSLKFCDNTTPEQINTQGCFPTVLDLLNDNLSSLGLATFFISLFQLCGVTLAICLGNHINKGHYEEMF